MCNLYPPLVFAARPPHQVTSDFSHVQVMLVGMSGRGVTRLELEFDAGNWHVPQRVAVAAVDDEWVEGPHTVLIVHSVHTPLGLKGPGTAMVLVDVADNDAPGARILPANVCSYGDDVHGSFHDLPSNTSTVACADLLEWICQTFEYNFCFCNPHGLPRFADLN